jgi:uncharacterized RDD family membrane protein YckC/ABC-type transport system involved in multi-copper enzyme maturation permease subunit
LPKLWQRVVAVSSVVLILLIVYAVQADENDLGDVDSQIGYSCVFLGLWWILSAVLSATAISQEKETDTWTLLLTTPMNGRQIVWGKVAGLLRRLLWPTVLIAVHFLLFAIGGVIPFWSILFVLFMVVACNSVWIATGTWLSLRMKKVTFSVVANLMLAIFAYGVVPLMVLIPAELLTRRGDRIAEHTAWYIPYFYLAQGFEGIRRDEDYQRYNSNPGSYSNNDYYWSDGPYWLPSKRVQASTFFLAAFVCALGHLALALLILHRTANAFDEIVGRAGRRQFVGITDTDDAILASVEPNPPANGAVTTGTPDDRPQRLAADLYASPSRRLVAWAVDFLIVQASCGALALVWGIIHVLNESIDETSESDINDMLARFLAWGMVAGLLAGWLYWAGFESSRRRATPGKALLGIFVTDDQGKRISFARATGRYFSKFLSILPLGIGLIETFIGRRKQAMHDRIAGTQVLRK